MPTGKTLDARKKQPKPAGTSSWNPTMIPKFGGGKNTHVSIDPRKKVAKPAPTSNFESTMI
jgi:hypothetical protein